MTAEATAPLLYAIPLLLLVFWHVRGHRRRESASARVIREVKEAGLTEPASLHPVIDAAKCCGSGACAKACPEEAIGFVGGKAVLANPRRASGTAPARRPARCRPSPSCSAPSAAASTSRS